MPQFCPSCEASNSRKDAYCVECGTPLAADSANTSTVATERSPRRTKTPARAVASRRAPKSPGRRQLAQAERAVRNVRHLFFWLFVLYAIGLTILLAYTWFSWRDLGDTERATLAVSLAMSFVVTGVSYAGYWQVQRNPLVWGLGLAGLLTVSTALWPGVISALMTVCAWLAMPAVLRLERWKREDPDNPAWERIARGSSADRQEARERRKRASSSFPAMPAVSIAFGAVLATFGILLLNELRIEWGRSSARAAARAAATPDEPIDETVRAFERAWTDGDFEAIGALYSKRMSRRATRIDRLPRRFASRDLAPPLPRLLDRTIQPIAGRTDRVEVFYRIPEHDVTVTFAWDSGEWGMTALRFD